MILLKISKSLTFKKNRKNKLKNSLLFKNKKEKEPSQPHSKRKNNQKMPLKLKKEINRNVLFFEYCLIK